MKVIDLLNKIANGEEVPKRIMYNNIIYTWDIVGYLHYEDKHYSERAFLEGYRTDMCLNDEVEIIEDTPKEDKKIEKIKNYRIKRTMGLDCKIQEEKISKNYSLEEQEIVDKINEIIDKINGE